MSTTCKTLSQSSFRTNTKIVFFAPKYEEIILFLPPELGNQENKYVGFAE
jgi:hypothetical protein